MATDNRRTLDGHLRTLFGERQAPDGSLVRDHFARWFGECSLVDAAGRPLIFYHGTTADFSVFQDNTRGLHCVSPSPQWVFDFLAGESGVVPDGAAIMPVYVAASKIFDFENKKQVNHVAAVASLGSLAISQIRKGDWIRLEDRTLIATLKALGFDGLYLKEKGVKNLALFKPQHIKSAIGNSGAFDPADPDISDRNAILGANALRAKALIEQVAARPKQQYR